MLRGVTTGHEVSREACPREGGDLNDILFTNSSLFVTMIIKVKLYAKLT